MHCVRFGVGVVLCTSTVLVLGIGLSSKAVAQSVGPQSRTSGLQIESSSASTAWVHPVTSYGDPDLEGVWMNNRATPLERPKALEGRPVLTDAEVAVLQQRADRLFKNGNSDYAAGDAVFLSAFANLAEYKNVAATASSFLSLNTVFDNRTALIVDPPDGRIPTATAGAQQRRAAVAAARVAAFEQGRARPKNLSNALRCLTWGTPRLLISPYTSHYQIIQAPGYVVLHLEADVRIIPTDGRPHLTSSVQSLLGDSRGRWEGNTLIVDTTNFSPKSDFMGSSEHLHLVERFTRVSADTINYDITIEDPTTWARPWTVEIRLAHTDDVLYEDACHEGNYEVMRGMLAAPRVQEKADGEIGVR
jgi:hypothetical protein